MLSQQEQLKYSRQIMLPKIAEQGQLALRNATVLIVGVGGLGNPCAQYLAAAGIGKLILIDGDTIELSNLPRQLLFNEHDLNRNKAETAAEKLHSHYPDVSIEAVDEMLDDELGQYYIEQVDLVLDCSDNMSCRHLINQLCVQKKKPLVIGAAIGFDGQHLIVDANQESACYHCLYPANEKAPVNNCQTAGVIGPVLAIIAGMQSMSAIKLLTGLASPVNQLSLFDGLANQWQQFAINKQPDCPICGC